VAEVTTSVTRVLTGGERNGEGEDAVASIGGTRVVGRPRRQTILLNELADHVITHNRRFSTPRRG